MYSRAARLGVRHFASLRTDWDVLVITDAHCEAHWKAFFATLECHPGRRFVHALTDGLIRSYYLRYRIGDWPQLFDYETAVYVDADVLTLKDPSRLTHGALQDGMLYVKREQRDWENPWFRTIPYTKREKERLRAVGAKPFNSGLFMFRVTHKMVGMLTELLAIMEEGLRTHVPHKGDQSFTNRYFNLQGRANTSVLEREVTLFAQTDGVQAGTFAHFIFGDRHGGSKAQAIDVYLCRHGSKEAELCPGFVDEAPMVRKTKELGELLYWANVSSVALTQGTSNRELRDILFACHDCRTLWVPQLWAEEKRDAELIKKMREGQRGMMQAELRVVQAASRVPVGTVDALVVILNTTAACNVRDVLEEWWTTLQRPAIVLGNALDGCNGKVRKVLEAWAVEAGAEFGWTRDGPPWWTVRLPER